MVYLHMGCVFCVHITELYQSYKALDSNSIGNYISNILYAGLNITMVIRVGSNML